MKNNTKKTPPVINAEAIVADIVTAYPEALEILLQFGFTPLKNPMARKTIAKFVTLKQAAELKGIDLKELLSALKQSGAKNIKPVKKQQHSFASEDPVPKLQGDITVMGLVPCPVRGTLVESFSSFIQKYSSSSGLKIAWWLAGEGIATDDLRAWLEQQTINKDFSSFPDIFLAVGSEMFFQKRFGALAKSKLLAKTTDLNKQARTDFENLTDPQETLLTNFCVTFSLICQTKKLPKEKIPNSWQDLADPDLKGKIGLPSLDLPVIPDILAALYDNFGEKFFSAFVSNIKATMHPAKSSPRENMDKTPEIMIMPNIFALSAKKNEATQIIPSEGSIAIPAFITLRADARPEAKKIISFLLSKPYQDILWQRGKFFPNCSAVKAPLPNERVITRSWQNLYQGDPEKEAKRLIEMITAGELQ
jgi:putative spermidine/putrescine transport system substrate-binding protein